MYIPQSRNQDPYDTGGNWCVCVCAVKTWWGFLHPMGILEKWWANLHKFWRNTARTKSQHQRPFPVKGVTRCKEAGKPRMESTQLTTMYWQYAREMSR